MTRESESKKMQPRYISHSTTSLPSPTSRLKTSTVSSSHHRCSLVSNPVLIVLVLTTLFYPLPVYSIPQSHKRLGNPKSNCKDPQECYSSFCCPPFICKIIESTIFTIQTNVWIITTSSTGYCAEIRPTTHTSTMKSTATQQTTTSLETPVGGGPCDMNNNNGNSKCEQGPSTTKITLPTTSATVSPGGLPTLIPQPGDGAPDNWTALTSKQGPMSTGTVAGIIVGVILAVIILLAALGLWYWRRKRNRQGLGGGAGSHIQIPDGGIEVSENMYGGVGMEVPSPPPISPVNIYTAEQWQMQTSAALAAASEHAAAEAEDAVGAGAGAGVAAGGGASTGWSGGYGGGYGQGMTIRPVRYDADGVSIDEPDEDDRPGTYAGASTVSGGDSPRVSVSGVENRR